MIITEKKLDELKWEASNPARATHIVVKGKINKLKPMIITQKQLDETDKKILALLFEGKTAKEIGKAVFKSSRTVEGRLRVIRDHYDCRNNVQLAAKLNK